MGLNRSLKHGKITGDNATLNTTGFVDNAWTFDSTNTTSRVSSVSSALSAAKKAADNIDDNIDVFQKYNKNWNLEGLKTLLKNAETNSKQTKTKVNKAITKLNNDLITAKDLYNLMNTFAK